MIRTIEESGRVYAIGDIHACAEELIVLLDHLRRDEHLVEDDTLIFIGDYIDRGPDSRLVVQTLIDLKCKFPRIYFLRGNHEDMLLSYLGFEGSMGGAYMYNGGVQFFRSYGLSSVDSPEQTLSKLPVDHVQFFLNLERGVTVGDHIFVHAGFNPSRSIEDQLERDLYWIREEFIHNEHSIGKTVVFGHTPYEDVFFHLPFKIGIDTGLVYGNRLTCIEVTKREVLQVERGGRAVVKSSYDDHPGGRVDG